MSIGETTVKMQLKINLWLYPQRPSFIDSSEGFPYAIVRDFSTFRKVISNGMIFECPWFVDD